MLCQECWSEEARVHFRYLWGGEVHDAGYCLACAQQEPMSWLLAWSHGPDAPAEVPLPEPVTVHVRPSPLARGMGWATLVATALHRCGCGCRIVVAANMPCGHDSYAFGASRTAVNHICHCGREHVVLVPQIVCSACGAAETLSVIGTAETCSSDEQRRRLVAVHDDLRHGRTTWGTFSIRN